MKKRILVVDDDTMNLKRAERILKDKYEVVLAQSGKEALDFIICQEFDLVLLDIAMPEMDGIETFKRMKEFAWGNIPVIFLTASGDESDVRNAIKLGAINYLKKPFPTQELLNRVATGFEKK